MDPNIQAQANQSAANGQNLYNDFRNKASTFGDQFNQYRGQTDQAQQALKEFTNSMVDPNAMYRGALGQARTDVGYDPEAARMATQNLIHGQSALNQIDEDSQRGMGGAGMTASQAAAMYGSQIQSLQKGISNANGAVGAYNNLYQNVLSQAGTQAQQGYQEQALKQSSLKDVFSNAVKQQEDAAQAMQFYENLSSQQGGLNASQAQAYAAAQQGMASAKQALAQASLFSAETTGQNIKNVGEQNLLDANKATAAAKAKAQTQKSTSKNTYDVTAADNAQKQSSDYLNSVNNPMHGLGNMNLLDWFRGHAQ